MDESEENRLKKLQLVLLLAAFDMRQAEAAARALEREDEDLPLMLALEAGMVVCYVRAFTQSSLMILPPEYAPSTSPDAELHQDLCYRRDKIYAHTDKDSGRTASIKILSGAGDVSNLQWEQGWNAYPRELIPPVIDLFQRQHDRFIADARDIQTRLDAEGAA